MTPPKPAAAASPLPPALSQKLAQAELVVEEAFDTCPPEAMLVAWSAGKDSTLVLKLVLDVCKSKGVSPPIALDIDQKDQFEELEEFRGRLAREWDVELLIVRNDDVLKQVQRQGDPVHVERLNDRNRAELARIGFSDATFPWASESPACNQLLKTVPVNEAIENRGIRIVFTGIRWDEHPARENETYFSPRENPPHTRAHPLLHFTERDVWDATLALGIPHCSLYNRGYRSLGTRSGTQKPSDIPAWQQDLEHTKERTGRSAEKEKMMEQLREWGYI